MYPFGCQTTDLKSQVISTCSQSLVNKCSPRTQHLIGNICIPKFLSKFDFISVPDKIKPRFSWNYIQKLKKICIQASLSPTHFCCCCCCYYSCLQKFQFSLEHPLPQPPCSSVFCFVTKLKLSYRYHLGLLA